MTRVQGQHAQDQHAQGQHVLCCQQVIMQLYQSLDLRLIGGFLKGDLAQLGYALLFVTNLLLEGFTSTDSAYDISQVT